ncbi:putative ubiquitin-like-specific protease 1B [Lolium perenne]|uniref:putative ubiquitin-like-specific protease 1B n=1 Tax=Lolium perenne TaxID=4522 RepID=UPI0021F5D0C0|nr:putative ubiquitin-like-specific protease 1B [Lolium perenne]
MNTDAGHIFFFRKRHRLADDDHFPRPKHRRLHEPRFLFDAVPCCLLRRPPIPPEAGVSAFNMGNFLSNACPGCMPRDGGLEMYRDWTDASKDARDLTVATRDGVGLGHGVLNRRILDPRKAALQAVVPPWEKREPHYKDALKKARLPDKRLGELEAEARLQKEKLDELRKPKEDLSQFFIPLTPEDEEEVHDCLYGSGSSNQVLVLHESSNIEISKEKIRCLRPHGWLNDEVINLFLELLKERGTREPKRSLKCHFFNTFFYKKLACGKNGYDYKSVKRWTTHRKLGYELIECDKIFVPVHQHVHWCLAIINMKAKTLQYLDSLGGNDPRVPEMLARYIVEEVKDKSNKEIDINSWTKEVVDYVPLQQNGYDCGMFMLKYMDFLSRGASLSFGQEHMEYFRKRTVKEIKKLRAD